MRTATPSPPPPRGESEGNATHPTCRPSLPPRGEPEGARNSFPSPSQGEIQRGSRSVCLAKGRVKRSWIRQTSDPCRQGSRLRHQDVQNYPMGSDRAQTQSRSPGPRSGNVGGDRIREASSSTPRATRRRLMDCDPHAKGRNPLQRQNKNQRKPIRYLNTPSPLS